jgi:hypothetical protein
MAKDTQKYIVHYHANKRASNRGILGEHKDLINTTARLSDEERRVWIRFQTATTFKDYSISMAVFSHTAL